MSEIRRKISTSGQSSNLYTCDNGCFRWMQWSVSFHNGGERTSIRSCLLLSFAVFSVAVLNIRMQRVAYQEVTRKSGSTPLSPIVFSWLLALRNSCARLQRLQKAYRYIFSLVYNKKFAIMPMTLCSVILLERTYFIQLSFRHKLSDFGVVCGGGFGKDENLMARPVFLRATAKKKRKA